MKNPRQSLFLLGLRDIAPILLGVVPFGLISGVAAVSAGLTLLEVMGASIFVFAGASQLAGYQLIALSSPVLVIWLSTFFINLRFTIYGASLAPHFAQTDKRTRALLSYMVTDQAYAMSISYFKQLPPSAPEQSYKHWYYVGMSLIMWVVWQLSTLVGAVLGAQLPSSWSLDFAIPLTFMALALINVSKKLDWLVLLVSAATAVWLKPLLPYNLGLIVASVCAIVLGTILAER